jgi:group I intron endonuclease
MVIYKTINLVNGKFYIGQDSKNDSNYLGSGSLIKKAIKKYGRENFKKEILEYCKTNKELNNREIYWIEKLNAIEEGYNITTGGEGTVGYKFTEEQKNKMSQSHKGKKLTNEHKENIGIASKKRWSDLEYKENVKKAQKNGRSKLSIEDKILAESRRIETFNKNKHNYKFRNGQVNSIEHRLKISKSNTGKKMSEESRIKMKESKTLSYLVITGNNVFNIIGTDNLVKFALKNNIPERIILRARDKGKITEENIKDIICNSNNKNILNFEIQTIKNVR